jgi:hypothetical protein
MLVKKNNLQLPRGSPTKKGLTGELELNDPPGDGVSKGASWWSWFKIQHDNDNGQHGQFVSDGWCWLTIDDDDDDFMFHVDRIICGSNQPRGV